MAGSLAGRERERERREKRGTSELRRRKQEGASEREARLSTCQQELTILFFFFLGVLDPTSSMSCKSRLTTTYCALAWSYDAVVDVGMWRRPRLDARVTGRQQQAMFEFDFPTSSRWATSSIPRYTLCLWKTGIEAKNRDACSDMTAVDAEF